MSPTNHEYFFKTNAGLKDIIGRGLIYDDNIAVIELVKNSKDASASLVTIQFHNETQCLPNSYLMILDNGSGMSKEDITTKWLNIAYSEKALTENKNMGFAGNKGIGRFSCDRLGTQVTILTKKEKEPFLKLQINWKDFENKSINDQINSIPVTLIELTKMEFLQELSQYSNTLHFEHGTALIISNLRTEWPTSKMKKLIDNLEKFSPSLEHNFDINIFSNSLHKGLENKLNTKIHNNILDKLQFKTTYIKSRITSDGEMIYTELYYQGNIVYKYSVKNPYDKLKNIQAEIHYLDILAKSYFTKHIGVRPVEYGSVFLFYNGFRVAPYGDPKNDWLGLNERKAQGTNRNLGNREIFGKISITDNDDSFQVLSSREGLAKTPAFKSLVEHDKDAKNILDDDVQTYGYIPELIRQLETFTVSGLDWNRFEDLLDPTNKKNITEHQLTKDPQRYDVKPIPPEKVSEAVRKITKNSAWKIKDFWINQDILKQITEIAKENYRNFVNSLIKKIGQKNLPDLDVKEKINVKQVLLKATNEAAIAKAQVAIAEKVAKEAKQQEYRAIQRAELAEKRTAFFEKHINPKQNMEDLISHIIKITAGGLIKDIKALLRDYYDDPKNMEINTLVDILEETVFQLSFMKETAIMSVVANFNLKVKNITADILDFIRQYFNSFSSYKIKIHLLFPINLHKKIKFSPGEFSIFLSNILDNARKAGARNLYIKANEQQISFSDDGEGIDLKIYPSKDHFKKGITTTLTGTGLGLFQCKLIADSIKSTISLDNDPDYGGARITLKF